MSGDKKRLKFLSFIAKRSRSSVSREKVGHLYYKMGCPIDTVLDRLNKVYVEVADSHIFKNLKIKSLEDEGVFEDFVYVFNRSLLTGFDPYQPIDLDEVKRFPKTTFVGYLYGRPVAFIVYSLEEKDSSITGVIAGIGVIPEYRGRGVAKSMVIKTAEIIKSDFNVSYLECDVYEGNKASLNLVSKFGFRKVGEFVI